MSDYKTWFVYDKKTGYILSGFDCCCDDQKDGFNIYTRPYKHRDYYPKDELCRLDFIYKDSVKTGLKDLRKEDLVVTTTDETNKESDFIENPNYFSERGARRGWWKLRDF